MGVFIKIGFAIIYYFLASVLDSLYVMFFGDYYISFLLTCLTICVVSCAFRHANIYKRNYLQEQRDAYAKSFKSKFRHIVFTLDFLVESVLGTVVLLLFTIAPRVGYGACYSFGVLYIHRVYGILLIPIFVVVNFFIWYFAYQFSFRKKKY